MPPPGWPRALVPAEHEDFEERAVAWLLDAGPAELRQSSLRQYPIALACYLRAYIGGALEGARLAYGQARTDLGPHLEAQALDATLQAVAAEGARLVALQREIDLVVEALRRR
ncbi:MAG: hypothetical protein PHU75_04920 [Candidatus Nanopelagicales bacterium]|nr:hypothetical protein [Candidatus Nanopelagicales bacterium]